MKNEISEDLIRKYISGSCTTEEQEAIDAWYTSFEQRTDPLLDLQLKEQLGLKVQMMNQIRANIGISDLRRKTPSRIFLYTWIASVAAVLFVLFGLIFYKPWGMPVHNRPVQLTGKPTDLVQIRNKTSSFERHVLSDGSVVWLSPFSSISYNKSFARSSRNVSLNGDAFFEVTKDKKHPFIIYGGQVITKVWGTSFSITYDAVNKATEVAVLTGKVSVRPEKQNDQEVLLLRNQKAVYSRSENTLSKMGIARGSSVRIWKKESVVFEHITVSQISKMLNEKFNVNIEVGDATLGNYVLKADFTGHSLPEILYVLEKSLEIKYTIEGKNIKLYKQ